jgi:hypothetical protein
VARPKWRDPEYLSWWWHSRVSLDAKVVAAVIAIGLLGIGGYVAANGLEGSVAGAEAEDGEVQLVTTTVRKLVTVRKAGQVVTTPSRVVARRVAGGAVANAVTNNVTQVRVETVAGTAGTRVVTEREVVPVVRQQRVTVAGGVRVRTVVEQAPAETQTRTVEQVVERVVDRVVERVVTEARPVTVVVTQIVRETVVVTVAPPPVTVTAGPITITVTVPLLPPRPPPRP